MTLASRREVGLTMGAATLFAAHARPSCASTLTSLVTISDKTLTDPADGRIITVRVFAPSQTLARKFGLIVFSHGANSSGALYDALLAPLAQSGFVVVAPTHVDSETNPNRASFDQAQILTTRLRDLDIISQNRSSLAREVGVSARAFNIDAAIIAGHSYGALLALYSVGAGQAPFGAAPNTLPMSKPNPLFRCAIAISPPGPIPGFLKAEQFDTIAKPILITTGEKDILPGFVPQWQMRLSAFQRARLAPAYAAILPDVDHYFGGAIGRLTVPGPPQSQSLEITTQVCSLFARGFGLRHPASLRALAALTRRSSQIPQLDLRQRN